MKKWFSWTLRIVVFTLTLIFLFTYVDFKEVISRILYKVPIWTLIVAILLSLFRVWLNGRRWKICNTDSLKQLSSSDYFRYMMISSSLNLIMPGVLGGDVVKAIWMGSDVSNNKARNVLSVFFDRAIGIISIIILGLLSLSLSPLIDIKIKSKVIAVVFALLLLFLVFILLYRTSFLRKFRVNEWMPRKKIYILVKNGLLLTNDIIKHYYHKPVIFFNALFLSFIIHISWFFVNYLISLHLKMEVSFFDISMISCLVWIITVIPISISGIGVREISYIGLLGTYGVTPEQATALSLYIFSITIILAILGLPFIFTYKKKKVEKQKV